MANEHCVCGAVQTGVHGCVEISKQLTGLIFVKLVGDDGVKNSINPATLTSTDIQNSVNNTDLSKRYFVFTSLDEITRLPIDKQTITTKSGVTKYIKKTNTEQIDATKYDVPRSHIEKLNKSFCEGYGVYYIVDNNIIQGSYNEADGMLYPRKIDNDSLIFQPTGDNSGASMSTMQILFIEAQSEDLASLAQVKVDESGEQELVEVKGFTLSEVGTSANKITVSGVFPYSTLNEKIYYTQAITGDWTITSTGGSVTVDSVAVSDNAGVCEIAITWSGVATAGDDYTLSFSHNGLYAKSITGTLA